MGPADPTSVVHLELHTPGLPQARAFYSELCGWRSESVDARVGSYVALDLGSSLAGGIVQCPIAHPLWLPYVQVADVGEATARARRLGARVLLDAREGPAGWRAVVATPAGGEIAFWQSKLSGQLG